MTRRKLTLICLLLAALAGPPAAVAQVETAWVRSYRGPGGRAEALDMVVDRAGNVYVTGRSRDADSLMVATTIKYDTDGEVRWVARYDGPWHTEAQGVAITVDRVGSVYVVGSNYDAGGVSNYVTLKYDSSGNLRWAARDFVGCPNAIAVDARGNVAVTGVDWSGSTDDYATASYDSLGRRRWSALYNGGIGCEDEANAVVGDAAGSVYVTGLSQGENHNRAVTVKWDSSGSRQWAKRCDVPGFDCEAFALALGFYDYVCLAGCVESTMVGDNRGLAACFDREGNQQWAATAHAPGCWDDWTPALALDRQGFVVTAGAGGDSGGREPGGSNLIVLKYDWYSNPEWAACYGTRDSTDEGASAVATDTACNIYAAGWAHGALTGGNYEFLLVKFGANGNLKWAVRHHDPPSAIGCLAGVGVDSAGNSYIAGYRGNTVEGVKFEIVKYVQTNAVADEAAPPAASGARLAIAPDPFRGATSIRYESGRAGPTRVRVFDVRGRMIRTLVNAMQGSGRHAVTWDGRDDRRHRLAPGVYFLRLDAPNQHQERRVVMAE